MRFFKSLDLYPNKIVGIKNEIDGNIVRTTLFPGQDTSTQPDPVQNFCRSAWTADVIADYEASLAT